MNCDRCSGPVVRTCQFCGEEYLTTDEYGEEYVITWLDGLTTRHTVSALSVLLRSPGWRTGVVSIAPAAKCSSHRE